MRWYLGAMPLALECQAFSLRGIGGLKVWDGIARGVTPRVWERALMRWYLGAVPLALVFQAFSLRGWQTEGLGWCS